MQMASTTAQENLLLPRLFLSLRVSTAVPGICPQAALASSGALPDPAGSWARCRAICRALLAPGLPEGLREPCPILGCRRAWSNPGLLGGSHRRRGQLKAARFAGPTRAFQNV